MSERIHTYLIITKGSQPEQVVVWDTLKIRVGRHFEQDLVLDNPEISREHAELRRDGEHFIVEDLQTANGTFVNGEPIRSIALAPNDQIGIAEWTIRFCQSQENPAANFPQVTHASHLNDMRQADDDASDRTMLGLEEEVDPIWDTDSRLGPAPAPAPVRDLDADLEDLEALPKDETPPLQPPPTQPHAGQALPEEPDALMDSALDLGLPLPPVGREVPELSNLGEGEVSAPTFRNPPAAIADPAARSVDITLQLDGVDPELLRVLQSLLGKRFDMRALSLLLKAIAIR